MSPARKTPAVPWLRPVPGSAEKKAGAPRATDAELIAAVVRGDGAVAGELYDRLFHTVDQTLFRILGRRESDHEDLVQSAFEQIVKTLATRRFAGACSLKTWAASVSTHVGLNALRSRRRERGVFDRNEDSELSAGTTHDDPERDAGLRAELAVVRRELAAMNPARGETLFLHQVLGYDLAEIAALTGTSIAAAQSRLVRGRHELFERLGKDLKKRGGRS